MSRTVKKSIVVEKLKFNREVCCCGLGLIVKQNKSGQDYLYCEHCGNVFPYYGG